MRKEFPRAVRVAVIKRSTRDSVVYCEECGLPAKKFQIDHMRPDGLLGKPTLENAKLICEICYRIKNPQDTSAIARAKRKEAAHLGAKPAAAKPLQSRGFQPTEKAVARQSRAPKPALPPKQLFRKA